MLIKPFNFRTPRRYYLGPLATKVFQISVFYHNLLKSNRIYSVTEHRHSLSKKAYGLCKLIHLTYLFMIPQLKNMGFTSRNEVKIKKFFKNIQIRENEFDLEKSYAVLEGWMAPGNKIVAFDKNHVEIKSDTRRLGIIRKDVLKIKGKHYKNVGFNLYFSKAKFSSIHHISSFDTSQKSLSLINLTNNVTRYFSEISCEICNNCGGIGFIDHVIPRVKLNQNFIADLIVNLFLSNKFLFDDFYSFTKRSDFYIYFEKIYLNMFNLVNEYSHLIDSDNIQDEQCFKTSDGQEYIWKELLYSINYIPNRKMAIIEDTELICGKFLIKNNQLINNLNHFHDKSLISGESGKLMLDRERTGKTKIAVNQSTASLNIDEAVVLPSLVTNNYFHFLIENCPNVWFNRKNFNLDIPVVIDERSPKSFQEILEFIGFTNFYRINDSSPIRIKSAVTFYKSIILPDALELDINDFSFDSELFSDFRNYILDMVMGNHTQDFSRQKKVFFVRFSNNKNVVNLHKLIKIAQDKGYIIIEPSSLSFKEQVRITNSAEEVIIAGGAAMANLLFLNTNSKVYFLTNSLLVNYSLPLSLTSLSNSSLTFIPGDLNILETYKFWTSYDVFHSSYSVNENLFKKLI